MPVQYDLEVCVCLKCFGKGLHVYQTCCDDAHIARATLRSARTAWPSKTEATLARIYLVYLVPYEYDYVCIDRTLLRACNTCR